MKKLLLLTATCAIAACHACASTVVEWVSLGAYTLDLDFKVTMLDAPREVRLDLLAGRMPEPAAVPVHTPRVTRDQRPLLQLFTLHRNDFAF